MKQSIFLVLSICFLFANSVFAQDIVEEYNVVADRFTQALLAADANSLAQLFTKDCVFTDHGGVTANGKKNVLAYYEERMKIVKYENLKIVPEEVVEIGDGCAFGRGYYTATVTIKGKDPMQIRGNFQNVAKRKDGEWKIYRHLASVPPPPSS